MKIASAPSEELFDLAIRSQLYNEHRHSNATTFLHTVRNRECDWRFRAVRGDPRVRGNAASNGLLKKTARHLAGEIWRQGGGSV